jgi:hypothetical protein
MATSDPRSIKLELVEFASQRAYERLQEITPSRRLRDSLRVLFLGGGSIYGNAVAFLEYPEYWAVYLHDGHQGFEPTFAKKLVFFSDPNDDPRIAPIPGGYPTRFSDSKRLTAKQYAEGLRKNRERARQGGTPFMYVLPSVGPWGGYKWLEGGGGFQDGGMRGFVNTIGPEMSRRFSSWIKTHVATSSEARVKLRLK